MGVLNYYLLIYGKVTGEVTFFYFIFTLLKEDLSMKKILYLICIGFFAFTGCGDDDKLPTVKGVTYVDLSDLVVYKGGPSGAEEIVYNDLKNRTLATYFFKTLYQSDYYNKYTLDFYENRLTYIFLNRADSERKIVSTYEFKDDKLYILTADTLKFVAYGNSPDNLYMQRSIARYPLPGQDKDTIVAFDVTIGADTILKLAGYESLEELKVSTDTIVWCNIKYMFN